MEGRGIGLSKSAPPRLPNKLNNPRREKKKEKDQ
jgi:hypothetical protein